MDEVSVEQGGPLLRGDTEPRLHGDVYDLGVVLAAQRLVGTELLLELHQRRVLVTLGHLGGGGTGRGRDGGEEWRGEGEVIQLRDCDIAKRKTSSQPRCHCVPLI